MYKHEQNKQDQTQQTQLTKRYLSRGWRFIDSVISDIICQPSKNTQKIPLPSPVSHRQTPLSQQLIIIKSRLVRD